MINKALQQYSFLEQSGELSFSLSLRSNYHYLFIFFVLDVSNEKLAALLCLHMKIWEKIYSCFSRQIHPFIIHVSYLILLIELKNVSLVTNKKYKISKILSVNFIIVKRIYFLPWNIL